MESTIYNVFHSLARASYDKFVLLLEKQIF